MLFSKDCLNIFKLEENVNKNLRLFDPLREKGIEALRLTNKKEGIQYCWLAA
jgi:hypothetical protein